MRVFFAIRPFFSIGFVSSLSLSLKSLPHGEGGTRVRVTGKGQWRKERKKEEERKKEGRRVWPMSKWSLWPFFCSSNSEIEWNSRQVKEPVLSLPLALAYSLSSSSLSRFLSLSPLPHPASRLPSTGPFKGSQIGCPYPS